MHMSRGSPALMRAHDMLYLVIEENVKFDDPQKITFGSPAKEQTLVDLETPMA